MGLHTTVERVGIATGRREQLLPSAVQWSSDRFWRGIRLERRLDRAGEISEGYLLRHVIVLRLSPAIPQELYRSGRGWQPQSMAIWSMQVFPARVPFAARWDGFAEALVLDIAPEFLAAATCRETPHQRIELRPFVIVEDRFVAHTMLALEADLHVGSPAGRLYGETLGAAVAAHLVRKYTDITVDSHNGTMLSDAMLSLVLQYIGDNLDTDLPLQGLADLVQTDVYRFVRSFKRAMGIPPHQYILRERIERAKSLLCNPKLPLSEVALRSGFADQSHLTNAFHRMTNLSPRAYRNAVA
jgi:AraC family transcriptional regulator